MGVTSVSLKHYVMGHLGMIPDATLFCLVGASIASLSKLNEAGIGSDKTVLIITIVLTVVAIVGIVYMGIKSKRELMRIAESAKRSMQHINGSNMALIGIDKEEISPDNQGKNVVIDIENEMGMDSLEKISMTNITISTNSEIENGINMNSDGNDE